MGGAVRAQELGELGADTDIGVLLQVIERLVSRVQDLEDALGQARDEINRLKGEQGRPVGFGKKRQRGAQSSERERREPAMAWHKGAKLPEGDRD